MSPYSCLSVRFDLYLLFWFGHLFTPLVSIADLQPGSDIRGVPCSTDRGSEPGESEGRARQETVCALSIPCGSVNLHWDWIMKCEWVFFGIMCRSSDKNSLVLVCWRPVSCFGPLVTQLPSCHAIYLNIALQSGPGHFSGGSKGKA